MQVQLANTSFLKGTNRGTGNTDCWDRTCTRSRMMSNAARRILTFQSPVSWFRGPSTWCCYHLPGHPGCPPDPTKNALKISKHSGMKRWRSNCWEKRIMLNNDQKNNKKVKSAWEVFFFFFQFQSLAFTCWMRARCLTVRRLRRRKKKWCTGSKHPHRNLKTDLQVTKQSHLSESYSHAEEANSAESWKTSVIRACV